MKKNQIRIIAGKFKGRRLNFLDAEGLRPTTDRNKETLFNWLQFKIQDSVCLDLFAGSGSLAFEALSRGAAKVVLVEQNRRVSTLLSENLNALQIHEGESLCLCAKQYLNAPSKNPFDIVFLDPPFHQNLLNEVIPLLVQYHWIKCDSLIYVERELNEQVGFPENWLRLKHKQAGQVIYELWEVVQR